jgi:hypothetical protein
MPSSAPIPARINPAAQSSAPIGELPVTARLAGGVCTETVSFVNTRLDEKAATAADPVDRYVYT